MDKKFITRGDCLAGTLLQTFILALQLGAFLFAFSELGWQNRMLFALLILLQLFSFAFHWRRFLAYGKKEKSYEEKETP